MIKQFHQFGRLLRTISHLKPIQVAYQLKYRLFLPRELSKYASEQFKYTKLNFYQLPDSNVESVKFNIEGVEFNFLNQSKLFEERVNWNFQDYGKLWNYNLQYMNWLGESYLTTHDKNKLALDLYHNLWRGELLLEPYPASLRIMNAIRFLSLDSHADIRLAGFVQAEANFLTTRLEYHLLANHLLENAFAIYMAGTYFQVDKWRRIGAALLKSQLEEQILEDGAHFELSPMYHQIIFFRVLELLTYENRNSELFHFVFSIAEKMLSWLKTITFRNGEIPHFNDSTSGIAYTSKQLFEIATSLGFNSPKSIRLNDSGYRKFVSEDIELIMDVHGIAPDYQPGHAHADTFSFCLNYKNDPIIVDTGISTYAISEKRDSERSTSAHNTVIINDQDSAEVWAGFRVGRRLEVNITKDDDHLICASHDGYRRFGTMVQRQLAFSEHQIEIIDSLEKTNNVKISSKALFHFHPNVKIEALGNGRFLINKSLEFQFQGEVEEYLIEEFDLCLGYNTYQKAKRLSVPFSSKSLKTVITPKQ